MGAFGAGLTMAVASSVVLLVVSSVVAFKGWPDDLSGVSNPEVASLAQADGPVSPPPASTPVSFELPAASSRGEERGAGSSASSSRPATSGGEAETTATTEPTVSTPVASEPAGSPAGTTTDRPASPVTDVVRDTTDAVGDVAAPVTPAVGGVLESIGAAGADTVDQVSQTVDGAAQQLLP